MLFLLLILVFTVFVYLYYLKRYTKYNSKSMDSLPGPPATPLVGNSFDFKSYADFLVQTKTFYKKYGPTFKLRMGPVKPMVITCDPKFIGLILNSPKYVKKRMDYEYLSDWLGQGLITATPAIWKAHRKRINPTFHFKILEEFVEIFSAQADTMMKKLKEQVGNKSFDIYPYYNLCALDAICETAMGVSVNAQTNDDSEYVTAVKKLCDALVYRNLSLFFKYFHFLYPFTATYKEEKKNLEIIHNFANSVIQKRKRELKEKKPEVKQDDEFGIKKRKAFLDLLLEASDDDGKSFSDTELRNEVDTIMFGGHDTTSTSLSFLMHCLAQDPEVQKRAYEEVRDVLGDDKTRTIVYKDLADMHYVEQVIKESMRIYPPVPYIARELDEEVTFDGITYPRGTDLTIHNYLAHMNPETFPDPEKFDPDRFSSTSNIPLYSYIPFSVGGRNCIGQKYAMLEMKTLLAKMLINYKILPAIPEHHIELDVGVVMKSKNGVRIRIKERP